MSAAALPQAARERLRTWVGGAVLLLAVHTLWGVEKCLAFALSNGALSWENIPAGDKLGVAALLAASALYGRLRTKAG